MRESRFEPDYTHLLDAARNREPRRLPLYDHSIAYSTMEKILGRSFADGINGKGAELDEFFENLALFYRTMGYDVIVFEALISDVMPGNGCLGRHCESTIRDRADFERYPWEAIPEYFRQKYEGILDALSRHMPAGMKAIGGAGNGVFECVQDVIGFTNLCYIRVDDPELYADLFRKVGETNRKIWEWVIARYSDTFCVFRFGDDLGFKSATLLPAEDVRTHIIPQYVPIIERVHAAGKPFLLHSCGCIFDVMEDLIAAGIDAKHSNEDVIAPFSVWVERYGDRIGNFGGADVDAVCGLSRPELKEYITGVLDACRGHGGVAFGTGNSVPDYMPVESYLSMNEIAREYRGDYAR